jgi:hypothetical protein
VAALSRPDPPSSRYDAAPARRVYGQAGRAGCRAGTREAADPSGRSTGFGASIIPPSTSSAVAWRFSTELVHWPHDGGVDLVAVLAEVRQPALVLLGEHLPRQRLEVPHVVGAHPQRLADPVAVVVVHQQQVPEHPLLHVALAGAEQVAHVLHQVVALPLHHRAVAAARLHVVVAPLEHALRQPARISGGLFGSARPRAARRCSEGS